MTQTLKQGPNGPIVELDSQLAGELGLRVGSSVDVRREGGRLVIEESAGDVNAADAEDRERRFKESMDWVFTRYENTLRELSK